MIPISPFPVQAYSINNPTEAMLFTAGFSSHKLNLN